MQEMRHEVSGEYQSSFVFLKHGKVAMDCRFSVLFCRFAAVKDGSGS
jgi:hypothetical protein